MTDVTDPQTMIAGLRSGAYNSGGPQQQEPMIPRLGYNYDKGIRATGGEMPIMRPGYAYTGLPNDFIRPARTQKTATYTEYLQEFFDHWQDDNFQAWLMSRAIAAGFVSSKATIEDYLQAWKKAGDAVSSGLWKGTPEQYLEYMASGQSVSVADVQKAIKDGTPLIDPATGQPIIPGSGANLEPVNPITTMRSTQSATITREAAYAAADQMATSLLGHMATKKQMAQAYAVMRKLLAEHPTVTTTTQDATDPNNIVRTEHVDAGLSPGEAQNIVQQKMARSSEGTAYTVGNLFEDALRMMASKEA